MTGDETINCSSPVFSDMHPPSHPIYCLDWVTLLFRLHTHIMIIVGGAPWGRGDPEREEEADWRKQTVTCTNPCHYNIVGHLSLYYYIIMLALFLDLLYAPECTVTWQEIDLSVSDIIEIAHLIERDHLKGLFMEEVLGMWHTLEIGMWVTPKLVTVHKLESLLLLFKKKMWVARLLQLKHLLLRSVQNKIFYNGWGRGSLEQVKNNCSR